MQSGEKRRGEEIQDREIMRIRKIIGAKKQRV
jgi:hypothetical protein